MIRYACHFGALWISCLTSLAVARPFAVRIMDADTGHPVPLIRVTTTHQVSEYTDNAGLVTFDDPDLLQREIWLGISGHGYELPPDGFGNRGIRFTPRAGEIRAVAIRRTNIAERVLRLTGGGLRVHESRLAGNSTAPSSLPGLVFGCDTVDTAIHRGKMFWLWGDTSRPSYPLGNFDTTLATTPTSFDPRQAPPYQYFTGADGFVKRAAPIPGDGPTWLGALVSLNDQSGTSRLVATYAKIKPPLEVYERGLCEFDEESSEFRKILVFPTGQTLFPDGHAFRHDGWLYFGQATPHLKVRDNYESWKDPSTYLAVLPDVAFSDAATGKAVKAHHGSMAWNPWRKKWTSIFTENGGASALGEIRYAEAPSPEGPWRACIKIASHHRYTFYNPHQHPAFSEDGGRVIWFEGTYTHTFSGNPDPTPRHDYNQILYRLDLADPRMASFIK